MISSTDDSMNECLCVIRVIMYNLPQKKALYMPNRTFVPYLHFSKTKKEQNSLLSTNQNGLHLHDKLH